MEKRKEKEKEKESPHISEGFLSSRVILFSCWHALFSLGSFLGGRSLSHGSLDRRCSFGFLGAATTGALGSLLGGVFEHVLVVVDELDDSHLGVVTVTDTGLQDAGVTTGAVSDLLGNLAEEFVDGLFAVEVAEDDAAIMGGVLFRAVDDWLDIYAESFSFGNSGLDAFVHDKRGGHVGEHSNAVGVGS